MNRDEQEKKFAEQLEDPQVWNLISNMKPNFDEVAFEFLKKATSEGVSIEDLSSWFASFFQVGFIYGKCPDVIPENILGNNNDENNHDEEVDFLLQNFFKNTGRLN